MSFKQVLEELPALSVQQRQILMRRTLDLEDSPLSAADVALVESRLAAHRRNAGSSVSLDEMRVRIRRRSRK